MGEGRISPSPKAPLLYEFFKSRGEGLSDSGEQLFLTTVPSLFSWIVYPALTSIALKKNQLPSNSHTVPAQEEQQK